MGDSSSSSRLNKNIRQLEAIYEDVHRTLAVKDMTPAEESELHNEGSADQNFPSSSANGRCSGSNLGSSPVMPTSEAGIKFVTYK